MIKFKSLNKWLNFNLLLINIIFLSFISTGCDNFKYEEFVTVEELGEKLFIAFKKNDIKSYIELQTYDFGSTEKDKEVSNDQRQL